MFSADIDDLARQVIATYTEQNLRLVTAESCTGGLISSALTEIPGSSAVIERGFVTYSNDAKIEVLGVDPDLLASKGAVSADVAEAMAVGALEFSQANVAVSATGIAGPTGATALKPVGLVYIGLASRSGVVLHYTGHFNGDRRDVRMQAVREALKLLLSIGNS